MAQTIGLHTLLTDIDLLNVSKEQFSLNRMTNYSMQLPLYRKTIFSVNLNLVLGVLRHLEQVYQKFENKVNYIIMKNSVVWIKKWFVFDN